MPLIKKNTMNKDSSSNSSFLVLIILELNNIDQCFYQIVLFVARANQGSFKTQETSRLNTIDLF